ncbi:nitroreductase family protein [Acetobacterium bakii]|uniref:Putative nitroreductase TM1586 domain-containing protein n=1 Tax=Acetobacterium bakii TaxID=52689 RepID=A0A0L6U2M1_9FIRM|nr:nitroreductase family protein [Acetobacterium bakii]KNZ42764.1 hypothetical protein AKG39_04875 [Acetobacterium bakii]
MININWEDVIKIRRSARNFQIVEIKTEQLQALKNDIRSIEVPFEHTVECRFFKAKPTKRLYFSMVSPPDNLAFLSETDVVSVSKTGFIGELAILYAQSLGIATCWYGHYKLEELEKCMPHLEKEEDLQTANMGYGYAKGEVEGRRTICITPLGYHNEKGLRMVDRITEKFISYKRKPLEELMISSQSMEFISASVKYALNLARLAPSAANSQHWRFDILNEGKKITIAMPQGYKHLKWEHPNVDIGICASHFWLGLKLQHLKPKITITREHGRAKWTFELGD